MSEVEKAITINISRFVHSVEAVISDERGNVAHEHTTTRSQNIHGPTHKQLRGFRRRTRIPRIPCTTSKMEPRRMPRKMPKKAPKMAPRTAPRMEQGRRKTCGLAMPPHKKVVGLWRVGGVRRVFEANNITPLSSIWTPKWKIQSRNQLSNGYG